MNEYADEPRGDKRRFYYLMGRRHEFPWGGPEPDPASPGTKSEEDNVNAELLEGTREPRTDWERRYLAFMGGPHPKAERPKKWIKCQVCGSEYLQIGYPAGTTLSMATAGERTEHWLYPNRCQACADRRDAKPAPPLRVLPPPMQTNLPYKDPE